MDRVHEFWEIPPSDVHREKDKARDLRQTSWWRQKIALGICHYCGWKVSPAELTMDHIIPLSRGGRTERENISACCKECNNKKKYLLPVEWDEYVQRLRGEKNPDNDTPENDDGDSIR